MKTLIINDLHLGVKRQGGTTGKSREALNTWMLSQLSSLLNIPHDEVIVLGDLFDTRTVSEAIMLETIRKLKEHKCLIVLGNHDVGGYFGHGISSTEFVADLAGCELIREPKEHNGMYIIPHLFDQGTFDQAVYNAPANCLVLTHCNVASGFAVSDHSLNLSDEQITFLEGNGNKVIAAHEHTSREYRNVNIIGNQFPTSIADCLGGDKRALLNGESIQTWSSEDYLELDFTADLDDRGRHFVSVVGTCPQAEYASVVKRIAAFRAQSDAFVIKNNVRVPERERAEVTQEVNSFNIVDVFLNEIPEEFKGRVQACISQE